MTAVLGAARLLSAHREALPGTVVFLFQPDEEGNGGAQRMMEAGVLEGVDAVFGAHVTPDLSAGHVGVRYGKFYAASDTFRVTLTGRSAHGAEREKGVDALAGAARIILKLLEIPQNFPGERCVLSVGTLHAGTAGNIVADRAEFAGIIRTLGSDARAQMRGLLLSTVREAEAASGVRVHCDLRESYPGVVNDEGMTQVVEESARALLGAERVHLVEEPTMTTEDFGYFLQGRPGSFYHVGAGCPVPLHNAAFLPDDRAIVTAAALHAMIAVRAMRMFLEKC